MLNVGTITLMLGNVKWINGQNSLSYFQKNHASTTVPCFIVISLQTPKGVILEIEISKKEANKTKHSVLNWVVRTFRLYRLSSYVSSVDLMIILLIYLNNKISLCFYLGNDNS